MFKKKILKIAKIIGIQFLVIVISVIVFGEIALRFTENNIKNMRPAILQKESLQYVPSVFAKHVYPQKEQNYASVYTSTLKYGHPNIYINKKGYRGHDFKFKKDPGTIRIIIYGGSAVYNGTMPEGKDWPHRIEQHFHKDGFKNVEVINAGIPGHASADSVGRLFAEGHHFKPDYVVIYNTWNDVKRFSSNKALIRDMQPYQPKEDPFYYYQNNIDKLLGKNFLLYAFLRFKFLTWKYKRGTEGAAQITNKKYELSPMALEQFRLNIEMFVDCARNIGAVPVLMTQGSLIGEDNRKKDAERLRHVRSFLPYDFALRAVTEADNIIRSVAEEKQVDLIDAKKLLVEKDKHFYYDHVHLIDRGAEQLSIIVKDAIKDIIVRSRE